MYKRQQKLSVSVGNRQLLQPYGCPAHPNLSANSKNKNYFLITVKPRDTAIFSSNNCQKQDYYNDFLSLGNRKLTLVSSN